MVKVNIFVDDLLGLLESVVLDPADGFFLEMPKEIFHRGIIPAFTSFGHRGGDVILVSKDKIRLRCVLKSLVTVEDQSSSDLFFFLSLFDRFGDQADGVIAIKLMSYNETILEILNGGEIGPALLGMDVGHISDPPLVGVVGCEISIQYIRVSVIDLIFREFLLGFSFPHQTSACLKLQFPRIMFYAFFPCHNESPSCFYFLTGGAFLTVSCF